MKNTCTCGGLKDRRAARCHRCRMTLHSPRKGTGAPFRVSRGGYVMVMVGGKERYEHRVVMERLLGRKLQRHEHVHHKNGNRQDNRIDNLEVLAASAHHREHMPSERAKEMSLKGHAARWGSHASNL
jgi:hypothetical protein